MSDVRYWLAFGHVTGIGPIRLARLAEHFGDLKLAWDASALDLARAGLDDRTTATLIAKRPEIDLDAELRKVERVGARVLTLEDSTYPERLRQVYAAPPVLYVRGELRAEDDLAIAVVGTRRMSVYGRQATERITRELVTAGVTIVSGLARGVDTCAHRTALEAGGRTIAVLGCGVDVTYPPENARLATQIAERGAIVSDYPIGTKPDAQNFPARNRIISGMSRGTLVTEAGESSGALITSKFALEQNREVFAVPGSIFSPGSEGTNRLIQKSGAKLVTCAADVTDELELQWAGHQLEMRELMPLDDTERAVLAQLSDDPRHVDEVTRSCGLSPSQVSACLTMLELKGLAQHVGGTCYVLVR